MTKGPVKNVAASVHRRLLTLSQERNKRFNDLLQHYGLERWLYRVSQSEHAGIFILKGALMLTVWDVPVTRPTRDIDMLARTGNDHENIRKLVASICQTKVPDDGLSFDPDSVKTEPIAEDADYQGVRATFTGKMGNARIAMQIDFGFSDIVSPSPVEIDYPSLLGMPVPKLLAYNRETAIAEKFDAMVKLGDLNSRMKDFFDIWVLSANGSFDGIILTNAIGQTFARRGTTMDLNSACFTPGFGTRPDKDSQWKAFLKRGEIKDAPPTFNAVWAEVIRFLRPIAEALSANKPFMVSWKPGGPWV